MRTAVRSLFDAGGLQGVVHLLADDRETAGAGESELLRGACWVGSDPPIHGRGGGPLSLLIGALSIGFILSLLALGVYISFRIFEFPDITAEGSITLGRRGRGGADGQWLGARLRPRSWDPWQARCAGAVTGMLAMKFQINRLLAGILTMTALYSINLRIMGKSNIPLLHETSLVTQAESLGRRRLRAGRPDRLRLGRAGARCRAGDRQPLLILVICAGALRLLQDQSGHRDARHRRQRADDPRAGRDDGLMVILGLALSNSLVALSGALLAQYQGFADVQMGIGMVVWGLASVIIGEALVGTRAARATRSPGAIMGSVLFRLLVAMALRWGLNPNDLKLITAAFVFAALVLPQAHRRDARSQAAEAGRMLEIRNVRKTFHPGTPNEVRALQGVDSDAGRRVVHDHHRHQRLAANRRC